MIHQILFSLWQFFFVPFEPQQILAPILYQQAASAPSPTFTTIYSSFATKNFGSPYSLTLTGSCSSGQASIFVVSIDQTNGGTGWTPTLTDSAGGNTWTLVGPQITTGESTSLFFFHSLLSTSISSSNHFTLTTSIDGHLQLYASCITVVTTYDTGTAGSSNGGSTSWATSSITPAAQPEAIISFMTTTGVDTFTAGNCFSSAATTLVNQNGSGSWRTFLAQWRNVSSGSGGTCTATNSGSDGGPEYITGFH